MNHDLNTNPNFFPLSFHFQVLPLHLFKDQEKMYLCDTNTTYTCQSIIHFANQCVSPHIFRVYISLYTFLYRRCVCIFHYSKYAWSFIRSQLQCNLKCTQHLINEILVYYGIAHSLTWADMLWNSLGTYSVVLCGGSCFSFAKEGLIVCRVFPAAAVLHSCVIFWKFNRTYKFGSVCRQLY